MGIRVRAPLTVFYGNWRKRSVDCFTRCLGQPVRSFFYMGIRVSATLIFFFFYTENWVSVPVVRFKQLFSKLYGNLSVCLRVGSSAGGKCVCVCVCGGGGELQAMFLKRSHTYCRVYHFMYQVKRL